MGYGETRPTIVLAQDFGLSQRNRATALSWFGSTKMKSAQRGRDISPVEVTHISEHGIWLLVDERELFMPFEHFPWFRNGSIGGVMNVELAGPGHLYWPDLDVDLAVESIERPERLPLVSQAQPNSALQPQAGARRRKKVVRKSRARRG